jgi:PRC-barrel domain protein
MTDMLPKRMRRAAASAAAVAILLASPAGAQIAQPLVKAAAQATEQAAPKPKNLVPLDTWDTMGILGEKVVGPKGDTLGLVTNVIVDAAGRPRALVIDFGGFLGVGARKVAVDWDLFQFFPTDHGASVMLNLDRAEIQAAPAYEPGAGPVKMVGAPPLHAPAAPDVPK